jgi:hypothetical protein
MQGTYARVFDEDDVLKLLHSRIKSVGGQGAFAKQKGLDRTHMNMVLTGKRRLSPSIIAALDLRIVYVPVLRRPIARVAATQND